MVTQETRKAVPSTGSGMALHSFHPGWFGAVMGTAIVGVAAFMNPGGIPVLRSPLALLGIVMVALAWVVAFTIGVPYVLRWVRHPDAAKKDLLHPVIGAMYATFPAGVVVLATATAAVAPAVLPPGVVFWLVAVLGLTGSVLAFVASVALAYVLFVTPSVGAEAANGGWFIAPVTNIIVPMVLMPLIPGVDPAMGRFLLVASYAYWGMGFFLFLMVASLLYDRLVYHPLPAAPLAPSLWIGLGPIGVGGIALVRMAQGGGQLWGESGATITTLSALGALVLWGFGLWWLAASVLLLRRYLLSGGLPYGIGWWAFTFPVGAYTVDTLTLGRVWKVDALEWFGVLLFLLLGAFWLTVTIRTLVGIRTGEAWKR